MSRSGEVADGLADARRPAAPVDRAALLRLVAEVIYRHAKGDPEHPGATHP
jgi:hypothetical protein